MLIASDSGGKGTEGITVGSVTRDGCFDIVQTYSNANADIFLNNGQGVFSAPVSVPLDGLQIGIGDLNGDGIPDLADSNGCVAFGLGKAKFTAPTCYRIANTQDANQGFQVAVADLTKAKPRFNDVIVGAGPALGLNTIVSVLLNNGKGAFVDGVWTSVTGGNGNCGAAADFDMDGKPDLAVPTANGFLMLVGTGNQAAPYTIGSATTGSLSDPGCLITADVNGDSIPDILQGASPYSLSGGVAVYLGKGDGTFYAGERDPVSPGD